MTMPLTSQFSESQNPTLQARVQMAMCGAAQNIASADPSEPNHANRVNLAQRVSQSPASLTPAFTSMVCSQGITTESTDADISNMVSAVWNTLAGPPPA